MSSLFSSFDPKVAFGLPLNWLAVVFSVLLIPSSFWVTGTQLSMFWSNTINFVKDEFYAVLGYSSQPGNLTPLLALFISILTVNFSGLLPYVFPASSHLVYSVTLSLPLWAGHMVYSSVSQPNAMFAHLVPLGTPPLLMPFMVCIEVVSSAIRPITLSVRLAANIIAGHLLLTLMSSQAHPHSFLVLSMVMSGLIALNILESAVAVIQAYVFSVLSVLYLSEVKSTTLP